MGLMDDFEPARRMTDGETCGRYRHENPADTALLFEKSRLLLHRNFRR